MKRVYEIVNKGEGIIAAIVPDNLLKIYDDEPIVQVPELNKFLVKPIITITGFAVAWEANAEWMINGVTYTNPLADLLTVNPAATDKLRLDLLVADTSGSFSRIKGTESTGNPASPALPLNSLLVSVISVNDSTIDEIPTSAISDLISTDADNTIVLGADGKLYSAGGGGGSTPDATTSVKGKLKLAGDLGGTADFPTVPELANKVDKISGKGLSTNDFTTIDKDKLDNLSNYAGFRTAQSSLANVAAAAGTGTLGDWAIITNPTGNAYFAIWDTDVNAWVEAGQSPTIPGTNLAYTVSGNTLTITSDTGNDVAIPLATTSATGLMSKEDKAKLDGIASSATNFTVANVLATLLTGLSLVTGGAIVSTDSVLIAFGKIQKQLTDGFTTANIKSLLGISILSGDNTGDQNLSGLQPYAIARTGSSISFDVPAEYNSPTAPTTAVLTSDLTGAKRGVVQVIYSNRASFTFPSGWVPLGSEAYTSDVLNIIYARWVESARVEYWIVKG